MPRVPLRLRRVQVFEGLFQGGKARRPPIRRPAQLEGYRDRDVHWAGAWLAVGHAPFVPPRRCQRRVLCRPWQLLRRASVFRHNELADLLHPPMKAELQRRCASRIGICRMLPHHYTYLHLAVPLARRRQPLGRPYTCHCPRFYGVTTCHGVNWLQATWALRWAATRGCPTRSSSRATPGTTPRGEPLLPLPHPRPLLLPLPLARPRPRPLLFMPLRAIAGVECDHARYRSGGHSWHSAAVVWADGSVSCGPRSACATCTTSRRPRTRSRERAERSQVGPCIESLHAHQCLQILFINVASCATQSRLITFICSIVGVF